MTLPHACQPPYLARTGRCDCSRCCSAAPHDPGCMATEPTEQPQCTCPDTADYHHTGCPECDPEPDGRPLTDWERTHMLDSATAGDVDYSDLDDPGHHWARLPRTP